MSLFADLGVPVTAVPPGGVVHVDDDLTLELERVVPTEDATHYLWLVGRNYGSVLETLREDAAVESLVVLDEFRDRVLVRVRWAALETPFLELVEDSEAVLVGARYGDGDGGWTVTLRFPGEAALGEFYEASQRRGFEVDLRAVDDGRVDSGRDADPLTSVQRETLEAAFEAGYFGVPRGVTLAELADELGRSQQAVSEALRRAVANYLQATLWRDEADWGAGETTTDGDPGRDPDGADREG
jgi:predicted DNA binding protein